MKAIINRRERTTNNNQFIHTENAFEIWQSGILMLFQISLDENHELVKLTHRSYGSVDGVGRRPKLAYI